MNPEQAKLRAAFRQACKDAKDPSQAELWGFLGLEPLVHPPSPKPETPIRWCAQDDPWIEAVAALAARDDVASRLESPPERGSGRFLLGRRIETLARWTLSNLLQADLVAHNLPIYLPDQANPSSRRTIGELDLVYRWRNESITRHRELAAKWYIFDPDTRHEGPACPEGFDAWWGPMRRDRLDLKLGRMCNHQILLGQHPAARASLGTQSPGLHEIWLNGQLFWPLHLSLDEVPDRVGPRINPRAICGHWARHQQWGQDKSLHQGDGHWYVLDKATWLAQSHTPEHATLCTFDPEESWDYPRMLAHCIDHPTWEGYLETRRIFVVPNDWGRNDTLAKARAK